MSRPVVTVVVPVYNTAGYLEAALRSILEQSLSELEVICVDDGSTDESPALLDRLAAEDPRLRVMRQSNAGPGAARNAGVAEATGEYLYFFDSDDLLDEQALEQLVATARESDARIVYFDASVFTDELGLDDEIARLAAYYGRDAALTEPMSGPEFYRATMEARAWRPSPCLQLFERDWYSATGLSFPEGILHEDNLFSVQAALRADRVIRLPTALFRRRVRPNSIMMSEKRFAHVAGLLATARGFGALLADQSLERATRLTLSKAIRDTHLRALESYRDLGADRAELALDAPGLRPEDAALLPLYDRVISERRRTANAEAQLEAVLGSRSFRLASIPRRLVSALRGTKPDASQH